MYTKKNELHVLNTGSNSPAKNMALDSNLLENLDPNANPILHLYDWTVPSITYGYFIQPNKYLYLDELTNRGMQIAKRPTGGGIVFHLWDFAFSFLMPAHHPSFSHHTLENYQFVNRIVRNAIIEMGQEMNLTPQDAPLTAPDFSKFCMARPTIYDVVIEEKKVAGAAQRKTKNGYLHQGTISISAPDLNLLKEVILDKNIALAIGSFSNIPKKSIQKHQIGSLLESSFRHFL